ncbi:MAG TPA: hypothetical protein VMU19_07260 [Bryobacteraceae bacterium]|nr:hypothetical protein [Bryobacteraceae bacterium]
MKAMWCLLLLAGTLAAQKDFLTDNEVDKIREAQDPSQRMEVYAGFARARIDLVKSLMAKDKPGRSLMIHDALDQYSKILDAMNDVTDDALERHLDVKQGVEALERLGMTSLVELNRVKDSHPRDLDRYEFVLDDAIGNTKDSLDAARDGLPERARQVQEQQAREATDKRQEMAPADGSAPVQRVTPETDSKAPTLMRPGEKPPE